jgi:hypothetical protein
LNLRTTSSEKSATFRDHALRCLTGLRRLGNNSSGITESILLAFAAARCATDAAKISGISRAFAGRNSPETPGNLTGNFQKSHDICSFGLPAQLDRVTYQDIRHEFLNSLFRGEPGISAARQAIGSKDIGVPWGSVPLGGGR